MEPLRTGNPSVPAVLSWMVAILAGLTIVVIVFLLLGGQLGP